MAGIIPAPGAFAMPHAAAPAPPAAAPGYFAAPPAGMPVIAPAPPAARDPVTGRRVPPVAYPMSVFPTSVLPPQWRV